MRKILLFVHFIGQLDGLIYSLERMLAILRQLNSEYYNISITSDYTEDAISRVLSSSSVDDIAKFIEDHKWLALQYSAYCTQLMDDLKKQHNLDIEQAQQIDAELTQRLEAALLIAEFLEAIYTDYLDEADDSTQMHNAQIEYRKMLADRGRTFNRPIEKISSYSLSKIIHEQISSANKIRLFTVRFRRLLIASAAVLTDFKQFGHWMNWIEECTGPLVVYLSWMTLLPRLLKNLFLLTKHLIPSSWWMSEKEMALSEGVRFTAQLERHWFELANDIVTVGVGLLNCFALTGAANIYLGVSLLAFDVALASWRAHYELTRLREIEKTYLDMDNKTPADLSYLTYLQNRICYEELRHQVAIVNTVLLLLSASLTLPFIAVNLVIPLVGAVLAVLTTIANIIAVNQLEYYKRNYYKLDDKISYEPRPAALIERLSPSSNAPENDVEDLGDAQRTEEHSPSDVRPRGMYDSVNELITNEFNETPRERGDEGNVRTYSSISPLMANSIFSLPSAPSDMPATRLISDDTRVLEFSA